jgi:hypothetical protein
VKECSSDGWLRKERAEYDRLLACRGFSLSTDAATTG